LLTVSGIGPRLALATLAVLEPDALRAALADGNITALTQVPGIGRKGAERLVIELRDKVGLLPGTTSPVDSGPNGSNGAVRAAVVEALLGLGFAAKQAEQTVDGVLAENGVSDTAGVLRKALTMLGRKR
ncbi:MAG TPA: Holliday junction branch migration protein RuvA, partial [Pseudonocardiaceae bacterium]